MRKDMTDTQTPRPSLAELRALSASRRKGYENQAAAGIADTAFGSTVEIPADTFDALLDIACAARALDDCYGGIVNIIHSEWRSTAYAVKKALAKVRP